MVFKFLNKKGKQSSSRKTENSEKQKCLQISLN